MKKHKWTQETERIYGEKPHVCTKCGLMKVWVGGVYQTWSYLILAGSGIETSGPKWNMSPNGSYSVWKRPECK